MTATTYEHEPPRCAHVTRAVYRDVDDPLSFRGEVDERYLPESSASLGNPIPKRGRRVDSEERDAGPAYARLSNRRACMPYGATEQNEREEARDCPDLLERYRRLLMRRPPSRSCGEVESMTRLVFAAIDHNDFRPLLDGGWDLLRAAFAGWVHDPYVVAILEGNPLDREFRRRRSEKARSPFRSVASLFAAAVYGADSFGVGSGTSLDRVAESKGRTRAVWGEITCKESRAAGGSTRGLAAVERTADAAIGLEGLEISPADVQGVLDAGAKLPLALRLLTYRARLANWRCPPLKENVVRRVGREAAEREALLGAECEIRAATSAVTDAEIRKAISASKGKIERHLRRLPGVADTALGEGRPGLISDASQLHGLIPAREDSEPRGRVARRAKPLMPTYFEDDALSDVER